VHTYSGALQRNDQALFHYGFIQAHDPPKLAAQDMPGGNLYDTPRHSDADYSTQRSLRALHSLGCHACVPSLHQKGHAKDAPWHSASLGMH
jgi:hypothetical protein